MTKIDTVPFDKKHKKLLKKLQDAEKKHVKHGLRKAAAEEKMAKFSQRVSLLEDKIAAHEETHHEALAAVGQNSQSVSLKKAKR